MKNSKAAGRSPAPVAAPLADAAPPEPVKNTGWDPYEVWRTRVLLPRIEDAGTPRAVESNVKPLLRQTA